jgi:hypothetical protein
MFDGANTHESSAMSNRDTTELKVLDCVARELAETTSVKEVKAVRDKAEAARKYAQSATLGLRIQNQAAELKLRAERRAGELLAELVTHGGDRKSKSRDEILKLADLGIDRNQSARWRREASVPEPIFDQYISAANQLGRDITAEGLLRLERKLSGRPRLRRPPRPTAVKHNGRTGAFYDLEQFFENGTAIPLSDCDASASEEPVREMFAELNDHRKLLEEILKPLCKDGNATLKPPERRIILRLLRDFAELAGRIERSCRSYFARDESRSGRGAISID